MRKPNFQQVCLLIMTLCAMVAAARPLWVGWELVREPGKIRALEIRVTPPDDAPVSPAEMQEAEVLMLQIAGAEAPAEGFTQEKIERFARSARVVTRAREAVLRDRRTQELAYAESLVPRGKTLIGIAIALAAGWMMVLGLIWRRVGPAAGSR